MQSSGNNRYRNRICQILRPNIQNRWKMSNRSCPTGKDNWNGMGEDNWYCMSEDNRYAMGEDNLYCTFEDNWYDTGEDNSPHLYHCNFLIGTAFYRSPQPISVHSLYPPISLLLNP